MDYSSGGAVSTSVSVSSGGSTEAMDLERKRKRMLSNRESARRSRQRKRRHLDDLAAQAARLRTENGHALAALEGAARGILAVESENSVLRAQLMELAARLRSLDHMILQSCFGDGNGNGIGEPWKFQQHVVNVNVNAQPLATDMNQYC